MIPQAPLRRLVVVLGDQLDLNAAAFDGFDPLRDAVWMAEVEEESTHIWSSKQRIALFLSAMRHFAHSLGDAGRPTLYRCIDHPENRGTLAAELRQALDHFRPSSVVLGQPGDWRVLQAIRNTVEQAGIPLELREDRSFFSTPEDFSRFAKSRKSLRLEYFYRNLRVQHHILMNDSAPVGGQWNFDHDNREAFGPGGPGPLPERTGFQPDPITQEVLQLVAERFAGHPGSLDGFAWPVTREQALVCLERFVAERLALFGRYEDAMWPGEPWLYHSQLSAALNLKLLSAQEVVQAAENAFHAGRAPIESVEGFIRQILGWREYVRGIYWTRMPGYLEGNALGADRDLPSWYWSGETDMACLRDAIGQTLKYGYAHHIQRLMVTGLFALLFGVHPLQVHAWYLSVYVDAVEWVELPNTLGMSQYADGGLMASKPYAATGKYIQRMGGGCGTCRYNPAQRTGALACPFTTLYWDFLIRHAPMLRANARMALQVRNVDRLSQTEREAVIRQAGSLRDKHAGLKAAGATGSGIV